MSEKSDWSRTFNSYAESYKLFKNGGKKLEYASHSRMMVQRKGLNVIVILDDKSKYRSGSILRHSATMRLDLKQLDELTTFLIGVRMDIINICKDPRDAKAVEEGYAGPPEYITTSGKMPKAVRDFFKERSQ